LAATGADDDYRARMRSGIESVGGPTLLSRVDAADTSAAPTID
jgi:hypothetical protein